MLNCPPQRQHTAAASDPNQEQTFMENTNYLVISALGRDRPGIVNVLSGAVLESGCNIHDSRMAVLGGEFAVLMLISGTVEAISNIETAIGELERTHELTITTKRTGPPGKQADLVPYSIEVVSMDHPGIVHSVAEFFASRDINIEEMYTGSYAAAHTGTPMFSMSMSISIPAAAPIVSLRDQFMEFCDGLNLDATMEPIKR